MVILFGPHIFGGGGGFVQGVFVRGGYVLIPSLSFFTPTNLVLITGKKSMVLFILSEIIDLKNQEKNRKEQKISVLIKFHASLIKNLKLHIPVICVPHTPTHVF